MMEVYLFAVANWWAKEVGPDILIVLGPTPVIEWAGYSWKWNIAHLNGVQEFLQIRRVTFFTRKRCIGPLRPGFVQFASAIL